ncbi:PDZ domain-containing protein [Dyella solisilvae]|uniref:PDZ domain-containing protein n=1 Tax=Dyella solisilvae TaxID=1920168 RepID=A0A370K3Q3_9GAMM|nr:aspartyl protease family protein [Dyella solisilvae]RDI97228.1 PDZ domain-containing protein [Dyella solisilvae]
MARHSPVLHLMLLAGLLAPACSMAADNADTLLRDLRQAYGGERWSGVGAIAVEGRESSDGLEGPWQSTVDLRNAHYLTRARNDLFATAEGGDAQGHWRQDISGLIHPLDSDEAKTTAISEDWLRSYGFLRTASDVSYRALPDAADGARHYQRLEATPAGGRAVTLWIDPESHRVDRAEWRRSFLTFTQRFADYRPVDGLQLPFRITTTAATVAGTNDGESVDTVTGYRVLDAAHSANTQRPTARVTDVRMDGDARIAVTRLRVEGGIVLVDASINGGAPMPFILDSGGHAILTADAAKQLGFETSGKGVSTGSGPGSMSTAYTRVRDLALGHAHVDGLTFLVMPYPYDFYERGEGQPPIAGILGLEIFERFAVTFDYDRGVLHLQPFDHGDAPPTAKGDVLALRFTDDMPLVSAAQDGKRGMFGIDTGNAGYVLTFPQWAEREGIAAHYASGTPVPTGGVGGLFMAHIAHAKELQLGNQRLDNVVAMLTRADAGATGNPSEAGNIGQDVLSRYNVHFDYRRQQMVLMPRNPVPSWHYAMTGIRADKKSDQPDRYQVINVMPGSPAEQAGLKQGDAIMAVNGQPSSRLSFGALRDLTSHLPDGASVTLTLADGREMKLQARDLATK